MFIRSTSRKAHTLVHRFMSTKRRDTLSKNPQKLNKEPKSIDDLKSLSDNLPAIVSAIFNDLGSQQREKTYQQNLKIDLEKAGVDVTDEYEISSSREKEGRKLPSYRADQVSTMQSGEMAIIEIKAKNKVTAKDVNQLIHYMDLSGINTGFLINFPHDPGYPLSSREFDFKILLGKDEDHSSLLRTRALCLKNDPKTTGTEAFVMKVDLRTKSNNEEKIQPPIHHCWGKTKQGKPCKICIKKQDFCHFHEHQRPRGHFP